jgi:hypothetical protein
MSKHYLFQLYSYRLVSGLHDRVDVYELDILPKLDRMRIGDGNVKKNFHVGFLCGGCLLFRRHVAAKAQVTKPTAFTIRYTEKDVPASGMKPPATELHFGESYSFVRVDGAVADLKIMRLPDGNDYWHRNIQDPVSAQRIQLDQATESKTSYGLTARDIRDLKHPPGDCSVAGGLMTATGTMLGYKVVRETMENPKMGKRFEVWRAPDLNCAELRTDVFALEPPGGKATLQHTRVAVEVRTGEPDPKMFEVPDWPERSPSEAMEIYARKFHDESVLNPDSMSRLDGAYRARPPLQPIPRR